MLTSCLNYITQNSSLSLSLFNLENVKGDCKKKIETLSCSIYVKYVWPGFCAKIQFDFRTQASNRKNGINAKS